MNGLPRERWLKLWPAHHAEAEAIFNDLAAQYAQPHRHYHNARHINECLREFDLASGLAQQPAAVELALWFHDVIYEPRAPDNEERSAAFAVESLAALHAPHEWIEAVSRLVLATKHHDPTLHEDAPLLVDIDLSILGQPSGRFAEYEAQIRAEYSWVEETLFRSKRAEILERFLQRPHLYQTAHFFDRYEGRARTNLTHSLHKLRSH